jgi:hypothetical protein
MTVTAVSIPISAAEVESTILPPLLTKVGVTPSAIVIPGIVHPSLEGTLPRRRKWSHIYFRIFLMSLGGVMRSHPAIRRKLGTFAFRFKKKKKKKKAINGV